MSTDIASSGAIVGRTLDGRTIHGMPGTCLAHFAGRIIPRTARVWGGGETTMPYWADGNRSPYLTDDGIRAHCILPDEITCRTHSFEDWLKRLMSIGGRVEPRSDVPEWGNWYDAGSTPEEAITEEETFLKITRDGRTASGRSEAAA